MEHNYDIVALTEIWLTKDDQAEINVLTDSGYSPPTCEQTRWRVGIQFVYHDDDYDNEDSIVCDVEVEPVTTMSNNQP